jgi:hypothetical protein
MVCAVVEVADSEGEVEEVMVSRRVSLALEVSTTMSLLREMVLDFLRALTGSTPTRMLRAAPWLDEEGADELLSKQAVRPETTRVAARRALRFVCFMIDSFLVM